jgi:iron complex outermembrane recepter protein
MKHLGLKNIFPAAWATLIGLGGTIPAWAQAPAPAATATESAPEPAPQRIVVQGERQAATPQAKDAAVGVLGDLPLLDTPFSINVINRALLDQQQVAYLGDFLKNDPSAVVSNVPVGFLTLRGFPLGTDGTLYDGLPGHIGLTDGRGQLAGIERVEVLKGVSGFLYGMGNATSLGGVLNYLPKRPTESDLRSAELRFTSRSLWGVHADLGGRAGEGKAFGYRVNLAFQDGEQATDGYDWKQQVATLALDWRAAPGLLLGAQHERADNDLSRLQPFFVLSPGLKVPGAPDAERNIAQPWDDFRTRSSNTLLRADWSFTADWQLSAQWLHNEHRRPPVLNARFGFITADDGSTLLFGDQSIWEPTNDSAQLLLRGVWDAAGLRHQLTLGASQAREATRNAISEDAVNGGAPFPTNLYAPIDYATPARIDIRTGIDLRSRTHSLLFSDLITLSPRWSALLGLRRGQVRTQGFDIDTGAAAPALSQSATTPTFALSFKPTPATAFYANYGEGLEQGGTAPDGATNGGQRMPALRTRQIELGAKMAWDRLNLSASVFDMARPYEYSRAHTDETFTYVQDGRQRHRGVELMASGEATPRLTVVGGLMLLDPKSERTGDAATEGKRPVGVPVRSANLWAAYQLPGWAGVSVNGGVFHSGPQFLDAANTQQIPASTRFDLGAGWDIRLGGSAASFRLCIENVTDKDYWTSAQSGLLVLSDPRKFKLSAKFSL